MEKKEINQISNVELIKDVIGKAVDFLISQNYYNPNEETEIDYKIGYIYTRKDDYIEALFKVIVNRYKTFYMALQENKILLLKINESTYDATVEDMKNEHECLKGIQQIDGYHKELKKCYTKRSIMGIGSMLLILALIIGGAMLINSKVKLIDKTFKQLSFKVPSNYVEHVPLDSGYSSSTYYDNKKCELSLKYSSKFQTYNFDTASYDENNYTVDELYEEVDLEEKVINGSKWYYHKDAKGNYVYDYINKNIKYTVSITSNDDNYCYVNDIIESLNIK